MTVPSLEALAPVPAAPGTDCQAEVNAIMRQAGTSFAGGMALLPKRRREAMWALYAFARVIDDIADGPDASLAGVPDWPLAEKHRLLEAWRGEIGALYAGRPVSAVGQALARPVADYDLPQAEFLALIEGMQMDADGPILAPSMAELRRYTRRVAGAVGLLSMRIFGAWRGEVSERFALALGDAFQLTNILRDIETDAALGRLYMPREVLERHGLPLEPAAAARHPSLPLAAREIGALARAEFATALSLVSAHSRLRIAPALAMMGVYAAYLVRMEAVGFRHGGPVRLSGREKALKGLAAVFQPGAALPQSGA